MDPTPRKRAGKTLYLLYGTADIQLSKRNVESNSKLSKKEEKQDLKMIFIYFINICQTLPCARYCLRQGRQQKEDLVLTEGVFTDGSSFAKL